MALWDKIGSRGNVEDRRGMGPVAVGGIGLTGLAIYLLFNVLTGGQIDVGDVLTQIENEQVGGVEQANPDAYQGADDYEVFASTVLGSNNDLWQNVFRLENETYTPPRLVLFRTATDTACGLASSEVGPFYCSLDQTIYLDETFFDELTNRLGAQGGDVAQAYVIAHEVGHHVQNKLGIMDEVSRRIDDDNQRSIALELQADCFAGMWANSIKDLGVFEPGEVNEAMDAASAVGDDRVQEKMTGYVNPETWTHGSSEERKSWFTKGYESGNFSQCQTF